MGNEPWPIGVCPCPNGSRNKKNTFFLSSNLRMAMILNIHSLFFFQKVKLTYEYSAKYQPAAPSPQSSQEPCFPEISYLTMFDF